MRYDDILKEGLAIYGIDATSEMEDRFQTYLDLLLEWNGRMNLTAVTDERDIMIKHFLDSASCIQTGLDFSQASAIDVGTGAGFPGVPLKIIFPDMKLTLLDSLRKRIIFLRQLTEELSLRCEIIHGRAEDFGTDPSYRERYDIALSRAVANMNVVCEYTLPFVKVHGYFLCMKGPGIYDELKNSGNAIGILGGSIKKILSTNVYNGALEHNIALVEKVRTCPGKYPRKSGQVQKKPLM